MPLPRGDEYNQAIQNPEICFADQNLKKLKPETDKLGLPKPYSGGFATTYKLTNGTEAWAIRCFTRETLHMKERYKAFGEFYSKNRLPFLVEAKCIEQGIKVNGTFYPVIKMKWREWDLLNSYISKNLRNPNVLKGIIKKFCRLAATLRKYGIAHGDLQHGNIIVKDDKLYLIDYDCFYFPKLKNYPSNEIGHPNYQHPKRNANSYGPDLDNFSAIVIFSALLIIINKPELLKKYDNGENILFKKDDFINPDKSALLNEIEADSHLKPLAKKLKELFKLSYEQIPTLERFVDELPSELLRGIKLSYKVPQTISIQDEKTLAANKGKKAIVVGKIDNIDKAKDYKYQNKEIIFLTAGKYPDQKFTIVVLSKVAEQLKTESKKPEDYLNRWIKVSGVIVLSQKGKPQIYLKEFKQLQIIDKAKAEELLKNNKQVERKNLSNVANCNKDRNNNKITEKSLKEKRLEREREFKRKSNELWGNKNKAQSSSGQNSSWLERNPIEEFFRLKKEMFDFLSKYGLT